MATQKILKTKPFTKREQAVLDILNEEYQKHKDKSYQELGKGVLKQIQIAERWAAQQNKELKMADGAKGSVNKSTLKSGVNRAIPDLRDGRKAILEVDGGYLINNLHTRFYKYGKELLTQVRFADPEMFQTYEGAYYKGVYAIKVEEADVDKAKDIFRNLLGPEHCFSVNKWEDLVIILLRVVTGDIEQEPTSEAESVEEGIDVLDTLVDLVADVYQKQQAPPEEKKRQRKQRAQ